MKKFLMTIAAGLLVAGAVFAVTVTNRGEVITIKTLEDVIADNTNTHIKTMATAYVPIVVDDDDLTLAEAQTFTGAKGQLLVNVGSTGTTQFVYVNLDGSTNWVLLK